MTLETAHRTDDQHRLPAIVKNAASRHFSAVDLAAGEVLANVGEGQYPHTALFRPEKPVAYLLYVASAHLEVLDLRRLETIQRVEALGTTPIGSALGPDGEALFVGTAVDLPDSTDPGIVKHAVREDGRLESVGSLPLSRCSGMRVGPDDRLYVGQKREDELAVVDPGPDPDAPAAVADRIPVGEAPHDLYVLDDDGLVVANHADEAFAAFVDAAAGDVLATAETGENPHGFAVAEGPDYRYGLFPAREDERVAVVDLEAVANGDDAPTEALVDVGTTTGFAAAAPDGRYALVDSYDDPVVTILDLRNLAVAGRVEVGGEPLHLVVDDDAEVCYVGNMARPELAVLDLSPLVADRPKDVAVARRIEGLGEKPSGIFRPEVIA